MQKFLLGHGGSHPGRRRPAELESGRIWLELGTNWA